MQELELPSCLKAESAMLGSILLNPLLIEEAKRDCPVEILYSIPNRKMFAAMLAVHERKETVDSVLLIAELGSDLTSVGGAVAIANLVRGLPSVATLKHYIGRIREAARRRQALKLSEMLRSQVFDGELTADEIVAGAIAKLDGMRGAGEKRKPLPLESLADDQLLRYELFFKGVSDAIPTGFSQIDDHLLGGGLVPSGLYVFAASTSMGKTTLALDIAANVGSSGHRTYIVSREMSRESLFDRLVAFEGGVHRWKLRPGIWENDYRKALAAVSRLSMQPIVLDDTSRTVSEIRGYFRESEQRGERIEMLVVDYLQLLEAEGKRETRNQEVGSLSRSLKALAMDFRIPVIALSQLSRNSAKERREPELMDLRDSGEIEQDADAVFFLFGEKPEESATFYERTLKCSKQREGPLFRVSLDFNGELVTYRKQRLEVVA